MKKFNLQKFADVLSISLSGICLIHCLVFPLLAILLPILSTTILEDELFHKVLLVFVLPSSVLALFMGCRKHKRKMFLIVGFLGLGVLSFVAFFGHSLLGEIGEKVFTVFGGIIIAYAHFKNYMSCKDYKCS